VKRGMLWRFGSGVVMRVRDGSTSMGLVREMIYGFLGNSVGVASANKV
jgi:hypothetical protein